MKKSLLFALGALCLGSINAQVVTFSDDFESYSVGDYLGLNSSTWTTWGANGEGTEMDAQITDAYASSGTQSAEFVGTGGPIDMVLPLGNFMGVIDLEWKYYIPSGFGGYFNGQEAAIPGVGWAFECYMEIDGTLSVSQDGDLIGTGTFNHDEWVDVKLSVDLAADEAILSFNGQAIATVIWDTPLGGLNFFGTGGLIGDGNYYLDDVTVTDNSISSVELGYTPEFNVYPTPANDALNLNWNFADHVQASVYSMGGKLVKSQQFNVMNTAVLNVSDLAEGIYFIQLSNDTFNLTKKIIIKH